ncbi:hypothetical protein JW698_00460, partial [Candidatus Wolfebacteria bacterium]|nr:hypothetical protein [Candidatus Wolfebacteria bacterium]
MGKQDKAVVAKFSVLKDVFPKITFMRMTTLKCAGQCTWVIYTHILHFSGNLGVYENNAQINKRRKI